jgi:hypothetical protein
MAMIMIPASLSTSQRASRLSLFLQQTGVVGRSNYLKSCCLSAREMGRHIRPAHKPGELDAGSLGLTDKAAPRLPNDVLRKPPVNNGRTRSYQTQEATT